MSLCRWSSMNWHCDLYVYEAADGYVIHVAKNRRGGGPILLPHAGESFYCLTAENLAFHLIELRRLGYVFPAHVLDAALDDIVAPAVA